MPSDPRSTVVTLPAVAFAALALVAFAPPARAEVPDRTPEQLQHHATHLVGGEVATLYVSASREGDYEVTKGVAEIRVTRIEKGDGLKPGDLVYARYWRRRWAAAGDPPTGSAGHRELPKPGDVVRVYLKRATDGGYDVLLPNGFEQARPSKKGDTARGAPRAHTLRWRGGAAGKTASPHGRKPPVDSVTHFGIRTCFTTHS